MKIFTKRAQSARMMLGEDSSPFAYQWLDNVKIHKYLKKRTKKTPKNKRRQKSNNKKIKNKIKDEKEKKRKKENKIKK